MGLEQVGQVLAIGTAVAGIVTAFLTIIGGVSTARRLRTGLAADVALLPTLNPARAAQLRASIHARTGLLVAATRYPAFLGSEVARFIAGAAVGGYLAVTGLWREAVDFDLPSPEGYIWITASLMTSLWASVYRGWGTRAVFRILWIRRHVSEGEAQRVAREVRIGSLAMLFLLVLLPPALTAVGVTSVHQPNTPQFLWATGTVLVLALTVTIWMLFTRGTRALTEILGYYAHVPVIHRFLSRPAVLDDEPLDVHDRAVIGNWDNYATWNDIKRGRVDVRPPLDQPAVPELATVPSEGDDAPAPHAYRRPPFWRKSRRRSEGNATSSN